MPVDDQKTYSPEEVAELMKKNPGLKALTEGPSPEAEAVVEETSRGVGALFEKADVGGFAVSALEGVAATSIHMPSWCAMQPSENGFQVNISFSDHVAVARTLALVSTLAQRTREFSDLFDHIAKDLSEKSGMQIEVVKNEPGNSHIVH